MHDRTRPRLLILGCSTRAAAWSAVRAGFFPVCADEFGDADLHQVAEVVGLSSDVKDQLRFATHPALVALARMRVSEEQWWFAHSPELERLCGPYLGSEATANVFVNGWLLSLLLTRCQLPVLEARIGRGSQIGTKVLSEQLQSLNDPEGLTKADEFFGAIEKWLRPPPTDGTWLQKPSRSGGGRGIRFWTDEAASLSLDEPWYFQRYQPGQSCSAVFLGDADSAQLVGMTRQLIGDVAGASPWPFGYCGTIGPLHLPDVATSILRKIATTLVRETDLRGLFGIDFIWDGATPWVVEVNPRYTASCEILELALRRPLLTEHWQACLPQGDPPPDPLPVEPRRGAAPPVLGKMIVYAREAVIAPDFSRFLQPRSPWSVPYIADIPRVGTRFEPGQPVCTVFASGSDADECHRKLVRRANKVRRWLGELV